MIEDAKTDISTSATQTSQDKGGSLPVVQKSMPKGAFSRLKAKGGPNATRLLNGLRAYSDKACQLYTSIYKNIRSLPNKLRLKSAIESFIELHKRNSDTFKSYDLQFSICHMGTHIYFRLHMSLIK